MNLILLFLKNRYVQIGLILLVVFLYYKSSQEKISILRTQLEVSRTNEKALNKGVELWKDRYGREHTNSIMFSNSITQLKSEQDVTNKRILEVLSLQDKELKKLKQIGYIKTKVDTILTKTVDLQLPDTLIDLSDPPHLKNIIYLSPKSISSQIELENETVLKVDARREPIAPRKNTFFGRLIQNIFADKHIVTEVDVLNTNPYLKTKEQRFINIVKD